MKSKNEKKIPDGKYRIIKIGKEALFEFIYESFIENQERFFDVTDGTSIVSCFDIDWDKGEFICVARNEVEEDEHLQCDFDTQKLISKMENTTTTMFANNRYIEVSKKEIENL